MEQLKALFAPILEAVRDNLQERPAATLILLALIVLGVWKLFRRKKKKAGKYPDQPEQSPAANPAPLATPATEPSRVAPAPVDIHGGFSASISIGGDDGYTPMTTEAFRRASAEYVAFDLETTGLDEDADQIIEIGAVRVRSGQITDRFSRLVRPTVPNGAESVNHITPRMLAGADPIGKVLPDFIRFVGDVPVAAHNARFDWSFLARACRECGLPVPQRVFNTYSLTSLWPVRDKKLASLLEAAGVVNENPHRALGDAEALAKAIILSVPRMPDPEMQKRRTHSTERVEAVDNRLRGLRFVLTGDVPGLSRPDVERLIRLHGGRVAGTLSSVTNYLVEGEYPEAAPDFVSAKKKAALAMQAEGGTIRIIDYVTLFDMMGEKQP